MSHTPSSLEDRFQAAVNASRQLAERPDNATLLQIYALYKQGSEGDVASERPGMTDFVARAKWDAWQALSGTPVDTARQRYIDLIESLQ